MTGSGLPDRLPAAGAVACTGLWAMAAVDSSSSIAVTYVAHPYIGGEKYVYCCGERGAAYILLYTTVLRSRSPPLLTYVSMAIASPRAPPTPDCVRMIATKHYSYVVAE